jgi:hypothetical protein
LVCKEKVKQQLSGCYDQIRLAFLVKAHTMKSMHDAWVSQNIDDKHVNLPHSPEIAVDSLPQKSIFAAPSERGLGFLGSRRMWFASKYFSFMHIARL